MHCDRLAASRAIWTAGRSKPTRIAMMGMTTRSSMSVTPRRARSFMSSLRWREENESVRDQDRLPGEQPIRELLLLLLDLQRGLILDEVLHLLLRDFVNLSIPRGLFTRSA